MSEGLAGQAASAGPRTGSCCCSCKSAISVGETRWSGPLGLPQCRTALIHCPSASWQLLYTVPVLPDSSSTLYQCLQTAPLLCLSASRQLLYSVSVPPDSSSTLSQCLQTAPLLCLSASRQLLYSVSVPPDSSSTLYQCLQTAPLHCLSASRQLLYTVSVPPDSSSTLYQCLQTAPLHCLSASRQLLYTVSVPPDSSSTLYQCLQTAPLHCTSASRQLLYTVPVPPDSSSTLYQCLQTAPLHCLPAGVWLFYCVTLLLCDSSTVWLFYFQSCSPAPGVIEERGGEWGKQVGSMDEELQVRGCYNITFNCSNQETGSPLNQMHGQKLELLLTTCYCRDTGGKRTLWPSTRFNTLDNWGHKTPTQSNFHPIRKEKDRKERLKGHNPKHIQHTRLQYIYIYECRSTVVLTV